MHGWKSVESNCTDHEQEIVAEHQIHPAACIKCGVADRLYKHGSKVVTYRDAPMRGMRAVVKARLQRYKCRDCGETFIQPVTGIYPNMRMTARCVRFIRNNCLRDTFTRVSENVGCDEKAVRTIAMEYIDELGKAYQTYLPDWLGIDETMLAGELRCVLTDVGERKPIDILDNRSLPTIATWLHANRNTGTLKGVATDMYRGYKSLINELFPGIPVVIDKFHVVRMANQAVDKVRIRIGKSKTKAENKHMKKARYRLHRADEKLTESDRFNLDILLDNEPEIAAAYALKNAFYAIYDSRSRKDAEQALDDWIASVKPPVDADFAALVTAVKNWRTEILNIFDYPITNGYTEAVNGVAKVINRAGRGYTLPVLRAKMLYLRKDPARISISRPPMGNKNPDDMKLMRDPAPPSGKSILMKRTGKRCMSCHGLFAAKELDAYELHSDRWMMEDPDKMVLLCADCHRRFHTQEDYKIILESTR